LNRGILVAFGVAVFFAILFGSLTLNSALASKQPPVEICHVDPDNDGAGLETLFVNSNGLSKHLSHGDHEGACFVCGDGIVDSPNETCDDGEDNGSIGFCNDTCDGETPNLCGDGITTPPEVCDDANNNDGDGCNATCESDETCGNGYQDLTEVCDDGNNNDGDGCNATCESDETCGNGYQDLTEVCDDGNNNDGDGCNATCESTEICGNDIVDFGEDCDGFELNGTMCTDLGFTDGTLSCDFSCQFDTSSCVQE